MLGRPANTFRTNKSLCHLNWLPYTPVNISPKISGYTVTETPHLLVGELLLEANVVMPFADARLGNDSNLSGYSLAGCRGFP
jgi:hypothetical protein